MNTIAVSRLREDILEYLRGFKLGLSNTYHRMSSADAHPDYINAELCKF